MRNTRPASVSAMRRPIRSNSFVSCRASSAAIAWLTTMVGKRFGRSFALEQGGGHKFDPHHAHHPVFPNRGNRRRSKRGRFCGDLAAYFQRSRSLGWIFGLRSLHPKIPFPATEFGTATDQPAFGDRLLRGELRAASKPIADLIRALRTVGSILRERRGAARHQCREANDLRPRL